METFTGNKKDVMPTASIDKEEKARAKEQKKITKSEADMMTKMLAGMYMKTFGKTAFKDVIEYSEKTGKTLVDITQEIQDKKSPLSATSRKLIMMSKDSNRLKYLALAMHITSGLSQEDDFKIIEDKEETVEPETIEQQSEEVKTVEEVKDEQAEA